MLGSHVNRGFLFGTNTFVKFFKCLFLVCINFKTKLTANSYSLVYILAQSLGFFGMPIRSCTTSLHHGWFMGFFKTSMESFSLGGNSILPFVLSKKKKKSILCFVCILQKCLCLSSYMHILYLLYQCDKGHNFMQWC